MIYSIGWTDYSQDGEGASLDVRIRGSRDDVDRLFSAIARTDRVDMLQGADGRIVLIPVDAVKGRKGSKRQAMKCPDREHDEKEVEERPPPGELFGEGPEGLCGRRAAETVYAPIILMKPPEL